MTRLRFGPFELDPANHLLTRDGERVKLSPRPFRALVVLTSRAGTLVTRDELRAALWPDGIVVDFEHGLNTCIRQLRQALSDTAATPVYIETVPRVGYRFCVVPHEVPSAEANTARPEPRTPVIASWWRCSAAVGALAIMGLVLTLWTWPALRRTSRSTEAEALYVRGQALLDGFTPQGTRTALALFERAVALEPRHVGAHAGIALAYIPQPAFLGIPRNEALARARVAVERASALEPGGPSTELATAALLVAEGHWADAERHARAAIAVDPRSARAEGFLGELLALNGRFDEALLHARTAEALQPLSVVDVERVAQVLRYARRFDEAQAQATRALELDPNFGMAHFTLGHAWVGLGRFDRAIAEYERSGGPTGNLGHAYALAGDRDSAVAILQRLRDRFLQQGTGSGEIAQVLIGLGDYEQALQWLTREVRVGPIKTLKVALVWDPLRADPRFAALLRQSGFLQSP